MSAGFDYSFRIVRIKRGTTNMAADISYTALPLEVRGSLERGWADRHGMKRWMPLEVRLESEAAVPAERLRELAQELLADVADVWEGTTTELAILIRHTLVTGGPRLVERRQVTKSAERRNRESIARKLGKGVHHSRYGIELEGGHSYLTTWEEADRFVRSCLTADELRSVRVSWGRTTWGQFDDSHRTTHTVYADAVHLLGDRNGRAHVGSTAWKAVRHTLPVEITEAVEALAGEWHGTGLELLEAAQNLEAVSV